MFFKKLVFTFNAHFANLIGQKVSKPKIVWKNYALIQKQGGIIKNYKTICV